jgi:hypothetical protein
MHRRTIAYAVLGTAATLGTSLAAPLAQASDDARATVRIQPGDLRRGPDAAVLHSTGSTIHVGARDIRTDLPGPLDVVGRGHEGVIVAADNGRLYNVRGDGSTTRIGRLPGSAANIEVSTDGRRVAYEWRRHGHVKVTVENTATGHRLSTATFGPRVELAGYGKRRLLMSTWSPGRTFWYAPATDDRTTLARRPALDVDIAHDRIGFAVPDPNGYDGFCVRYSRVSQPRSSTWYSCKQTPVAWSARGGRVLTVDIRTDGLGPGTVQMRKVDGTRLRTFRSGLFGDVRFVTRHTVLLSTQGARQAALVRCTLEGGGAHCTRSTRLRPAHDLGPNTALRLSMPA